MATEKAPTPAYGSFKSLTTFFNARRDDGHITTVVDRSLMSNFNGSTANELLATLKFLRMINDSGKPLESYEKYVAASDAERKPMLDAILREAYPFVFANKDFNVERETSARMAELFRQQGISGSTLSRAVSFFLAAAKEAGIKVSPNIKPPTVQRSPKARKAVPPQASAQADEDDDDGSEEPPPVGYQSFEIPIPIARKVKILIPEDWSPDDWDLFQTMLKIYIEGWKKQEEKGRPSKDKGPAPKKEQTP